jgi:hypothetical protein
VGGVTDPLDVVPVYFLMASKRLPKPEEGNVVKFTVYLEPETHKALRIAFIADGIASTHFVERLIREYLAGRKKKGGRSWAVLTRPAVRFPLTNHDSAGVGGGFCLPLRCWFSRGSALARF